MRPEKYGGSPVCLCRQPIRAPGCRTEGGRRDWNDTLVLAVGAGSHWSPSEQEGSGVSALPPPPPARGWHICGQSLGVSTGHEVCLLRKSQTSPGRIRQYLLGTGGNKPARPTPPLTPKTISYGSKRKGWRGAGSLLGRATGGGRKAETPRLALVHILLLKIQG